MLDIIELRILNSEVRINDKNTVPIYIYISNISTISL